MKGGSKLKVAMEIAFMVSAAGVATILHNAPASAANENANPNAFKSTSFSDTAKAQGQAKAQVLQQISSATAGTLDFGKVVPTSASGTVTVAADGSLTNAGGARYIPNSGAHVATLSFSGAPNQGIAIDTPSSATLTNGSKTMTVDFKYPTLPNSIGASGSVTMNYGGTLNVGANQAAGIYSGTYDIFVTYV